MGNGNRSNAGFSVIEVLIAAGIFLIIAVGLLPLFVESIRHNLSGREATDVSNMGKSRLEEYFQFPFDSARLDVPDGQTELVVSDSYNFVAHTWTTTPPSGDYAIWRRSTRVRLFGINDLDEPLDGDTDPSYVHLKEIRVEVAGNRSPGNPLGGRNELVLQMLKAK